jgi:diacylglycerol kinase (ATP)
MKQVIIVIKTFLIYNPKSGRQIFTQHLDHVIDRLKRSGHEVIAWGTEYPGQGTLLAKRACEEHAELVIIVGGDGTFNECLNGIMQCHDRPRIGYIPAGTGCDLAHTLHLSKNIDKALDNIIHNRTVKMDVVKANERYFIYVSGNGAYIDISYVTDSELKKKIGGFAYIIKGAEELFTIPKMRMRITHDGGEFRGSYSLILIINSKRVAGINMIYKPQLDDGMVDVVLYRYLWPFNNLIYFLSFILPFWSTPLIKRFKTHHIKIMTDTRSKWNFDGEGGGIGNQEIHVCRKAIEIIVPDKARKHFYHQD